MIEELSEIIQFTFYLLGTICFAFGIGLFLALIFMPNKKDKKNIKENKNND